MSIIDDKNQCPSIYEDIFSNPLFIEQLILIIYSLIFIVGLVGNIMTIIIIKYNTHLRTPTNFYLLNLAVSDLMILMCNLPLEMLEIYNRKWPLSIIFCKLRNICAEFFTCSSILTILAFTCERYFAIVRPIHLHRLSHFRRAQNIIIIIWLISFGFSLPLGLSYEIETNSLIISNNITAFVLINNNQLNSCTSCILKKSLAKILSIIIIISSFCLFYFPIFIIAAIYLFIGKALRRVSKFEVYSNHIELSTSSQSSKKKVFSRKYQKLSIHFI
jgi:neuromedin U receptor 1